MVFSTWEALRTAIKDAIATHVAGQPCIGQVGYGDKTLRYRDFSELTGLLEKTYALEALESGSDPSHRVSYGRHRRFA